MFSVFFKEIISSVITLALSYCYATTGLLAILLFLLLRRIWKFVSLYAKFVTIPLMLSVVYYISMNQMPKHLSFEVCMSHITREKCLGDLGCFSANSPFFNIVQRPVSLLPDDREDINTKFQLYTPFNPKVSRNFSNLDGSLKDFQQSHFNRRMKTKIVVPGYISETSPYWKKPMVDALLTANDSNVFLVDWTEGDGPFYEQAVANTRVVGAEIALFVQRLQEMTGIRPESVHIIGHSLGSHIAGYAGKLLNKLGRITAMDPAGPYFTYVDPVVRLDRSDALLVDAIHTNKAETRFQGFGRIDSIGHFDFYPNEGRLQPGCLDIGHAIVAFLGHPTFDAEGLREIQCNHIRAIELFIASITNRDCEMIATQCDSWEGFVAGKCGTCENGKGTPCVPLGIHVDRFATIIRNDQSLKYYLNTTANPPYCV